LAGEPALYHAGCRTSEAGPRGPPPPGPAGAAVDREWVLKKKKRVLG